MGVSKKPKFSSSLGKSIEKYVHVFAVMVMSTGCVEINVEKPEPSDFPSAEAAKDLIDAISALPERADCSELEEVLKKQALRYFPGELTLAAIQQIEESEKIELADGITVTLIVEDVCDGVKRVVVQFRGEEGVEYPVGVFAGDIVKECLVEDGSVGMGVKADQLCE